MSKHAKNYRVVTVECRDLTDRPRVYQAGLTERESFVCAKCGGRVPVAGDEIHSVSGSRRAQAEPTE